MERKCTLRKRQIECRRSHGGIDLAPDADNDLGQGFDVFQCSAEVDNAGPQQEGSANDCIGEEGRPALLQARDEFRIQPVQVRFDLLRAGCEIGRDIEERGNAQAEPAPVW